VPTRVCPDCGEEYISTALACPDCGVALVSSDGFTPVRSPNELPPIAQLVCVRAASLDYAQGLSERLSRVGITHRLEIEPAPRDPDARRTDAMPYGVYVREHDANRAREIDAVHMRSQFPDFPDAPEVGVVVEGCPACGAAAAPDATECPDCGLALLEPA
jgi:hypothetical protein